MIVVQGGLSDALHRADIASHADNAAADSIGAFVKLASPLLNGVPRITKSATKATMAVLTLIDGCREDGRGVVDGEVGTLVAPTSTSTVTASSSSVRSPRNSWANSVTSGSGAVSRSVLSTEECLTAAWIAAARSPAATSAFMSSNVTRLLYGS